MYRALPDGRLLSANPAMARMFGFIPQQNSSPVSRTPNPKPTWILHAGKSSSTCCERKESKHFELQVQRKDGSKVWLWTNAQVIHEGNTIVRYEGTFEDITDRKLEDQLLQAQHNDRDIVENAVVGMFQSTPKGRYLSVNPAMASMLGYDSPQDLVASITDITRQVYVDSKSREEFQRIARKQGVATNFECQAYRKDGSKMWLCANVRAIFKNGDLVRYEGMNENLPNVSY